VIFYVNHLKPVEWIHSVFSSDIFVRICFTRFWIGFENICPVYRRCKMQRWYIHYGYAIICLDCLNVNLNPCKQFQTLCISFERLSFALYGASVWCSCMSSGLDPKWVPVQKLTAAHPWKLDWSCRTEIPLNWNCVRKGIRRKNLLRQKTFARRCV
jgi:hypothetical protein